ncbi:hypothetical protein [Amylibacter sp. IMCC11727]|uniref:hypothetical protein n=1 Tax=Amylibacter sp. IMCC11727 TaxID=3039851 RepID=UPI00244E1EA9|nr:hypothetical protein [Amylibacter sp. IMCC11727]WGI20941.1 hypothetical protein QBD29_12575 [Amylibacter sp. IMCC11727]
MRALILLLFLAACGRPLTENEMRFAAHVHGADLDTAKVRLLNKAPVKSYTLRARKRPRVACTERIYPEPQTEFVTGAPSAVALFNKVWVNEDYYLEDYMPDYGDKLYLYQALFLAHELTHAWQWQNRKVTKYHPLKAAREHQTKDDPYLIDPDTDGDFLSYGYEQQGRIVEEYLCCSLLDPKAPRTSRLEAMLKEYFPLEKLPSKSVIIGWKDVQVKGICRLKR